ncbi:hypothetical protein GS501_00365 [Saccharibacter sp. 17.LH.SD]|uniref:hypothetical protein n=1 Tax=Saccharibacter sp. 17.LH.SD TaxID=2689393 RepID=UPI00136DA800|nr:hypothetical protein [Saccharibacter sp. 17.LH.SD]MXV43533.1 hypothetical protein [Saccharibacter sp. 17.LH.SD]
MKAYIYVLLIFLCAGSAFCYNKWNDVDRYMTLYASDIKNSLKNLEAKIEKNKSNDTDLFEINSGFHQSVTFNPCVSKVTNDEIKMIKNVPYFVSTNIFNKKLDSNNAKIIPHVLLAQLIKIEYYKILENVFNVESPPRSCKFIIDYIELDDYGNPKEKNTYSFVMTYEKFKRINKNYTTDFKLENIAYSFDVNTDFGGSLLLESIAAIGLLR